jgi:UDP-glucose 4-epimerase
MTETTSTQNTPPPRIALIGAHTMMGSGLIERLENDPSVTQFWVFDRQPAKTPRSLKMVFHRIDLSAPGEDARLAEIFSKEEIDIVVHAALHNNPSHKPGAAHENDVIGTLHIINAAKASNVKKFVFCSSTMVYGASPKNPNYISESAPISQHAEAHFVRDKIEADRHVGHLFKEATSMTTTILRFALIVGPRSHNYFTELVRRPIVPTLLGYDPLFQFIHEDDALDALSLCVQQDYPGIFNIVGKGVVPLSYALRESGRISVPVATTLAYPLIQLLWNLELSAVPGRMLDYFRYLWVADGSKAREVMHFEPRYSSKDAFIELAKANRLQEYAWAQ